MLRFRKASASQLHHHPTTQASTSLALARMAHRFRGFCLGWRRAGMLSALPLARTVINHFRGSFAGAPTAAHVRGATAPHPEEDAAETQGGGARRAFGGSRYALCFTLQPLFLLRPCPAPCSLRVAGESGLAVRFGSFVCYRLELARRSHHVRIGAHFGRCRRCRGTTILYRSSLSVLPHC